MPKRVYKINNFHGGLNNSSDPRDVDDKELTECTDAMVDTVGKIRMSGSYFLHQAEQLDSDINGGIDGGGLVNAPGSGFFYFSHDRKGAEDAGDSERDTGDDYLALYDDHDAQIWVYSKSVDDGGSSGWDDDKDSSNNGVINFLGKSTSLAARPCFFSVDGAVRVSTGEFAKYSSGSLINDVSHFLTSETSVDIDTGSHLSVGNYVQIDDEVLYVTNVSSNTITFRRGIFGTKITQHDDDSIVYILNMNQWYGYINNKLFQNPTSTPIYTNDRWYNEIQHLRSLDELGITLALHDATSNSPAAGQINAINKIVVAYWFTTTETDIGYWNGTYWIGLTPVYEGDQEGPISTVGTTPLMINEEILNAQIYITHPDIDATSIATHPLLDDRITGLRLYTKQYTSDEWFLLKGFDLLEGGEHGWSTYNSDAGATTSSSGGNTLTGYWKTTSTADSLSVAAPSATDSYDGPSESNTCTSILTLNEPKGLNRVGILRLSGFDNSPLYKEVNLNKTEPQSISFDVVNPAPGTHKFIVELLDENFNIMARAEVQQAIGDSGVDASPRGGVGGDIGSGSS